MLARWGGCFIIIDMDVFQFVRSISNDVYRHEDVYGVIPSSVVEGIILPFHKDLNRLELEQRVDDMLFAMIDDFGNLSGRVRWWRHIVNDSVRLAGVGLNPQNWRWVREGERLAGVLYWRNLRLYEAFVDLNNFYRNEFGIGLIVRIRRDY